MSNDEDEAKALHAELKPLARRFREWYRRHIRYVANPSKAFVDDIFDHIAETPHTIEEQREAYADLERRGYDTSQLPPIGTGLDTVLIWSFQHRAWWKPESWGYTTHRSEAGLYDRAEAERIVLGANIACPSDRPDEEIREVDAWPSDSGN